MQPIKTEALRLPRSTLVTREEYVMQHCAGKKVLHIGCVDWPFTEVKFKSGTLLHLKVARVASRIAGLDASEEGIAWLRTQGMDNIYLGDAAKIPEILSIISFTPEIILAGELLEHLLQPADFLRGIVQTLRSDAEIIISVPNAFSILSIANMVLGREKVHSDHVAYYSYRTILELMRRTGFTLIEILPYRQHQTSFTGRVFNWITCPLMWFRPHFAGGYVLRARPGKTVE